MIEGETVLLSDKEIGDDVQRIYKITGDNRYCHRVHTPASMDGHGNRKKLIRAVQ